jgi:hypothetical protein
MTKTNKAAAHQSSVTTSGVACTLINTATYAGCGGYNGSDPDAEGRSLYVRPGWYTDEELDSDVEAWESLWIGRRDTLSDATAVALTTMGLAVPSAPAGAPPWDDDYPGTRQEWESVVEATAKDRRAYIAALQDVTSIARATYLRSRGWAPLHGWSGGAYTLVHDFGCRCGGWYGSYQDSDGRGVVVTRGGVTYFVNRAADIDDLLTKAEKAREKARDEMRSEINSLLSQMDDEQLLQAAKITLPGADLGHTEWNRQIKEKAVALRSSITEGISRNDYSEACALHWPDYRFRRSPDDAGTTAYKKVLEDGGADVLDASVAKELISLLEPANQT